MGPPGGPLNEPNRVSGPLGKTVVLSAPLLAANAGFNESGPAEVVDRSIRTDCSAKLKALPKIASGRKLMPVVRTGPRPANAEEL